jgi:hypothetical protein
MDLRLAEPEAQLVKLLLVKELEETRVEMHHAKNMDFKGALEQRERLLKDLLGRFA